MSGVVVAVDGPSGSGKSTVSRRVAAAFHLAYLDTGAMYRAATWWVLEAGVDLADTAAVQALVAELPLEVGLDPAEVRFVVGGHDVTTAIRDSRISKAVSGLSTNLAARAHLVDLQRRIVAEETTGGWSGGAGIVAEGRDITTVVAPGAPVRILLTADGATRVARRSLELHGSADAGHVAATAEEVLRRDERDAKAADFTTAADGVVTVDSSHLTLDQTVRIVMDLVARAVGTPPEAGAGSGVDAVGQEFDVEAGPLVGTVGLEPRAESAPVGDAGTREPEGGATRP